MSLMNDDSMWMNALISCAIFHKLIHDSHPVKTDAHHVNSLNLYESRKLLFFTHSHQIVLGSEVDHIL